MRLKKLAGVSLQPGNFTRRTKRQRNVAADVRRRTPGQRAPIRLLTVGGYEVCERYGLDFNPRIGAPAVEAETETPVRFELTQWSTPIPW